MRRQISYSLELWEAGSTFHRILNGSLGLPNFQRQFEWSSGDVKAFLSTVLSGLPSGMLMMANNADLALSLRALEGAPRVVDQQSAMVVLDGQQRLTALLHGAFALGPVEYFVDFGALSDGADIVQDDVLVARRRTGGGSPPGRALVPTSALRNARTFYSWLSEGLPHRPLPDSVYGQIFAESLQPIEEYSVPVTRLMGDLRLATVAQIFERTNKWGQRLNAFDLLVARVQSEGWGLREAWEESQDEYPEIMHLFDGDALDIVSAIGIVELRSMRRSDVLAIPPGTIQARWTEAIAAAAHVSRLLVVEGVARRGLVSYGSVVATMIAGRMVGADDRLLARYYWLATLNRWHEVASNTRSVSDFKWLTRGEVDPEIGALRITLEEIADNTRRSNRALWGAIVSTMLRESPRDIVTGLPILSESGGAGSGWDLVPIVKGGPGEESMQRVPLRLRTVAQLLALPSSVVPIRRKGFLRVVRERQEQLPVISDISEDLDSQLLPDRIDSLASMAARDLVTYRAHRVFGLFEAHIDRLGER